ncbi:AMP-binding protein [Enterovirga rhinocerotis]|uniref:Crotonobetaine/carnitine-CoA ligase n=1 Tax=Enterovirga rhinocerotis TaxID=1339210 RepID=A0A4V3DXM2_9HYPH|nr:AMP-binding protein [Enterovirga rhinocerotis]TDR89299.1 crotonobetaine/carnitine-CoA ligase [Enterovirga rhinocerotis]
MMSAGSDVTARDICVPRYGLERHAAERPAAIFAAFETGERWSFADTLAIARRSAAGLHALGVRRGDPVLVMLPNDASAIRAMVGIGWLGAVFVPVNIAYRGAILDHVVRDSGARVAIVHPQLAERLLAVETSPLRSVVVVDGEPSVCVPDGIVVHGIGALDGDPASLPELGAPIEPWDLQSIIYTSGTTGRSKGVLSSHMHAFTAVNPGTWTCLRPDDRQLLHMPIFHIGGAFVASTALCVGGSIAVVPSFRTETFWETLRALEVTSVFLLGAMATFLLKRPPDPRDREHPLRHVMIVPLGANGPPFRERFGVDVFTLFNMTEISTPLMSGPNPAKPNVCGRVRPGVEVRLVDAHDRPVPLGTVGELVIRADAPWAMSHGYHGDPAATAAAWRNGWFHTGDAFTCDADGDFSFVDRLKDAIRRRGENISSFEVETELLSHPDVREAAAVAVPSPDGEDEVLAVLAPQPDRAIDPVGILDHLRGRLPHFMLPRFIRIVPDLPKTPTAKVEKHLLRSQGLTPETWDRETAGIRIRREDIGGHRT